MTSPIHEQNITNGPRVALLDVGKGFGLLAAAAPVAFGIHLVNQSFPDQSERGVAIVTLMLAGLITFPVLASIFLCHRAPEPGSLGLTFLAAISVSLCAVYLYWASAYVAFPADFLVWSESDFVNDILKFRIGYPLYSPQVNNDSFVYVPGAQLLTYFLAWLIGKATSIPVYRIVQIGYTLMATVIAVACWRDLVRMSGLHRSALGAWGRVVPLIFFLVATNSLTNPYVHNLHNDALAQTISVAGYWLLLRYTQTRTTSVLLLMALLPALGFLVKQSLAVWAPLYAGYLLAFDRPWRPSRLLLYSLVALGALGGAVGACSLVWGDLFVYWTFAVMGSHAVSPLRSVEHVLTVWAYPASGLIGGLILVRGRRFGPLLGTWLVWLAMFSLQSYTSGIAWMLNHLGPSSLIAAVWLFAALPRVWPTPGWLGRAAGPQRWAHSASWVAIVCLLFSGFGVVRIPTRPLTEDAYRYVAEIEREFSGYAPAQVLLDAGTWLYLEDGVVMKDRAPTIGERGYTKTGDFSGILERLRQRRYSKILVRNLHSSDFWYDHVTWDESSEIRRTLLEHYAEVKRIKGAVNSRRGQHSRYLFEEVSVLMPKG